MDVGSGACVPMDVGSGACVPMDVGSDACVSMDVGSVVCVPMMYRKLTLRSWDPSCFLSCFTCSSAAVSFCTHSKYPSHGNKV